MHHILHSGIARSMTTQVFNTVFNHNTAALSGSMITNYVPHIAIRHCTSHNHSRIQHSLQRNTAALSGSISASGVPQMQSEIAHSRTTTETMAQRQLIFVRQQHDLKLPFKQRPLPRKWTDPLCHAVPLWIQVPSCQSQ